MRRRSGVGGSQRGRRHGRGRDFVPRYADARRWRHRRRRRRCDGWYRSGRRKKGQSRRDRHDECGGQRRTPNHIASCGVDLWPRTQKQPNENDEERVLPQCVEHRRGNRACDGYKSLMPVHHFDGSSYCSISALRRSSSSSDGRPVSIKRSASVPALLSKNFESRWPTAWPAASSRATSGR